MCHWGVEGAACQFRSARDVHLAQRTRLLEAISAKAPSPRRRPGAHPRAMPRHPGARPPPERQGKAPGAAGELGPSFTAAIKALGQQERWQGALSVLAGLHRHGPEPGVIAYGATIGACSRAAQWQRALALLRGMGPATAPPDVVAYGAAASRGPAAAPASGAAAPAACRVLRRGRGLVAVLKPPGASSDAVLASLAATGTAAARLSRLDFMTSGLLMAAVGAETSAAVRAARAQFAGRLVAKEYICLCEGPALGPPGTACEVRSRLLVLEDGPRSSVASVCAARGKEAVTRFEVLAASPRAPWWLLLARPATGRTHQIRAHAASLGRPLAGDSQYGRQPDPPGRRAAGAPTVPRLFLHCWRVALLDAAGEAFGAAAPLPADLADALRRVGAREGRAEAGGGASSARPAAPAAVDPPEGGGVAAGSRSVECSPDTHAAGRPELRAAPPPPPEVEHEDPPAEVEPKDGREDEAEPEVIRVSYMSVMHGDFKSASSAISRITERAAEVNRARSITGLLSYDASLQQVWQVLEGHKKDVMPIWESIQNDDRHAIDELSVSVEGAERRAFPSEWGMKLRLRGIHQM
ncbi:unnamed protein product [Prorocentrum cordatum]|uniref:BLUF domain-containing protein n=1 Tax=Prorocentrum cordatum TaxID=2364126 RepID=A0ABN9USH6_9DINO|nr:unnamed protein product [Polarella glacialis]